jgi:hypothetical protein
MSDTVPSQQGDSHQVSDPQAKDGDQHSVNEISKRGLRIAGVLLALFIVLPSYIIIAYWPDRLATAKERIKPLYINEAFHVRLVCIPDSICCIDTLTVSYMAPDTAKMSIDSNSIKGAAQGASATVDTTKTSPIDTSGGAGTAGGSSGKHTKDGQTGKGSATQTTAGKTQTAAGKTPGAGTALSGKASSEASAGPAQQKMTFTVRQHTYTIKDLIHINTLLLILVAAAGFAGNMIYIATSFTTFVGALKFKRSWILWYCVKPFTASALAIGLYFVFRGGFLNMSDDSTNINIYGIITLSLLTGLYTDRATLKLKDVVNTLFGIKEDKDDSRPNKLNDPSPVVTITTVTPAAVEKGKANIILINGTLLDKQKLVITIQDEPVTAPIISPTAISFQFTLSDALAALTTVKLVVKDATTGKVYYSGSLRIKKNPQKQA